MWISSNFLGMNFFPLSGFFFLAFMLCSLVQSDILLTVFTYGFNLSRVSRFLSGFFFNEALLAFSKAGMSAKPISTSVGRKSGYLLWSPKKLCAKGEGFSLSTHFIMFMKLRKKCVVTHFCSVLCKQVIDFIRVKSLKTFHLLFPYREIKFDPTIFSK